VSVHKNLSMSPLHILKPETRHRVSRISFPNPEH
jgi:hypothetical protein